MEIRQSAEDYLESILVLSKKGGGGYGTVTLLEKGAEIANQIYERHTVLSKMLEGLGVPSDIALEDACKMEHDISQESFEKIKAHYNKFVKKEETEAK